MRAIVHEQLYKLLSDKFVIAIVPGVVQRLECLLVVCSIYGQHDYCIRFTFRVQQRNEIKCALAEQSHFTSCHAKAFHIQNDYKCITILWLHFFLLKSVEAFSDAKNMIF